MCVKRPRPAGCSHSQIHREHGVVPICSADGGHWPAKARVHRGRPWAVSPRWSGMEHSLCLPVGSRGIWQPPLWSVVRVPHGKPTLLTIFLQVAG